MLDIAIRLRDGETPNRILVDAEWVPPGELERRARRDQERAKKQACEAKRNERLRRTEMRFAPDEQLPPDATPLERTLHGLLG